MVPPLLPAVVRGASRCLTGLGGDSVSTFHGWEGHTNVAPPGNSHKTITGESRHTPPRPPHTARSRATTVGTAFVLLKRGKDLFWILLGFALMAVGKR